MKWQSGKNADMQRDSAAGAGCMHGCFWQQDDWLRYFYDVKLGVVAGVGYIC